MSSLKTRLITIFLVVFLISWLLTEIFGLLEGLLAAVLCLSLLLVQQLWYVYKFSRFLSSANFNQASSTSGIWGEVYYRLHKLVSTLRDQVLDVEQQHSRFIQAVQATPNGVVMLNEDDQIEWCNSIAEKHFGINAKRDSMQRITHILRKPAFVQYIIRQNYREPIRLNNMGLFEQFSLDVQIFPYGDKQKLLLSQDVSQIEKTDSMRRDFVANVSHELKTPLTVLSGFLETVQELELNESDRAKFLNLMTIQTERMKTLVQDLLTLAKLEGNPEPPINQLVPMENILQRVIVEAEGLSQGKHQIDLQIKSIKNLLGDDQELYSAFSNLVSNAIRYTPEGGKITVQWFDDANEAIFCVTDTGPGIAEQHIPRLTERFYRIDRSRSRDTGGTGLGMAIVNHVMSRHHGQLKIESSLGVGSRFYLIFPEERIAPQKNNLSVKAE
jgi:two-component system, OmpR family, phosphate regulon sensor histidine kinase PhoR